MRRLASIITVGLILWAAVPSFAVPQLQLDVLGGTYDAGSETIIGPPGNELTLVALLTPQGNADADEIAALLADTYFIAVSLIPAVTEAGDFGSFTFGDDENTVNVTGDMVFGVPPIEPLGGDQGHDPGDLQQHGVFETYFSEHAFLFSSENTALTYDAQLNPGGLVPSAAGESFYVTFSIDTSLLAGGYNLHFDLYNEEVQAQLSAFAASSSSTLPDIDIDGFAPFSHDAQTQRQDAPEPTTLLLLGAGLLGLAAGCRRHHRKR
jgi:hypothetical protein